MQGMLLSSAWPQLACNTMHQKPLALTLPVPLLDQLMYSQLLSMNSHLYSS